MAIFTVTDGDPNTDEDYHLGANGIIIDPIVIGNAVAVGVDNRGGGGGGCAIASTHPEATDAAILLLPIFYLFGRRWARKRVRK